MTKEELHNLIINPQEIERTHLMELLDLSKQYPYSAPLHSLILVLLHKTNDLRFAGELSERALLLPDLKQLFFLLNTPKNTQPNLPMEQEIPAKEKSGFDLIDSFLEDHPDDTNSVESLLTPQIEISDEQKEVTTNPPTNSLLTGAISTGNTSNSIPPSLNFKKNNEGTPTGEKNAKHSDELFTETLARMYIKQGKFERAKNILQQINLEFPQKSGYFAEQLDFLERLIKLNNEEK